MRQVLHHTLYDLLEHDRRVRMNFKFLYRPLFGLPPAPRSRVRLNYRPSEALRNFSSSESVDRTSVAFSSMLALSVSIDFRN